MMDISLSFFCEKDNSIEIEILHKREKEGLKDNQTRPSLKLEPWDNKIGYMHGEYACPHRLICFQKFCNYA